MKKATLSKIVLAFGVIIFSPSTLAQQGPEKINPSDELVAAARGSVIFRLDDNLSPGEVEDFAHTFASQGGGRVEFVYTQVFNGFSAHMPMQMAVLLRDNNPQITALARDGIVTISQSARAKKGKPNGGTLPPQVTPWGITRIGGAADGAGLTAWVIDTGVDLDNADLNVDTAQSISFVTRGRRSDSADDQNGHGTHVAGTIAAIDNEVGVIGVAAGASVVSVRVLDQNGSGLYSWVIAGVDYVMANASPGDVANMSLVGGAHDMLDAAVWNAAEMGILFSLAAGNESVDAATQSPARVEHPNVYTVSAVDDQDQFASFSNYGGPTAAPVEYAAPGVDVLSLFPGTTTIRFSGTSMAAPHVAGILLFGPLADMSLQKDCGAGCAIGDPDGDDDPIAEWAHLIE
jgi:subtilisin family serine protease